MSPWIGPDSFWVPPAAVAFWESWAWLEGTRTRAEDGEEQMENKDSHKGKEVQEVACNVYGLLGREIEVGICERSE